MEEENFNWAEAYIEIQNGKDIKNTNAFKTLIDNNIDTNEFSGQGIGFPSSSLYSSGENSDSDLFIQEEPDNGDNEEDTGLSWQWQPLTLLTVYENSVDPIGDGPGQYVTLTYAISGGIPPYSYVLEGSPNTGIIENADLTFESPQNGTFDSSVAYGIGVVPQGDVSIEVPEGTYTMKISDSQDEMIQTGPSLFNNPD